MMGETNPFEAVAAALMRGRRPEGAALAAHGDDTPAAHREASRRLAVLFKQKQRFDRLDWEAFAAVRRAVSPRNGALYAMVRSIELLKAAHDAMARRGVLEGDWRAQAAAGLPEELRPLAEELKAEPATRWLGLVAEGRIESYRDRERARAIFGRALAEHGETIDCHELERGIFTYFDAGELAGPAVRVESIAGAVAAELRRRAGFLPEAAANLLWSADPAFLRHHLVQWLDFAPFLMQRGLGLVFLVTGETGAAAEAIDGARRLARDIAAWHGSERAEAYARSISFVPVSVPEGVREARVFHACARFLHAGDVIEATGRPVLVADIDMVVRLDPAALLAKAGQADAACTFPDGLAALYPWRRCMAGTVLVNATPGGARFLDRVGAYIGRGLGESRAWTLDQNALAYAMETGAGQTVTDIARPDRPLAQDPVRTWFERVRI